MDQHEITTTGQRRPLRRWARWGVVAGGLAVAGGLGASGASALAAPASATAAAPAAVAAGPSAATAAATPGPAAAAAEETADFSHMPEGYTQAQYEAFWGAGYTALDADALAQLWGAADVSDAKARAGQALLDGQELPIVPGATVSPDADPLWTAFSGAGYTYDDAVALAGLWGTDVVDAKARIGQAVLDGQELPIAPGSAPAAG